MLKSESYKNNLPKNIILSSGASCPDATVDRVLQKILAFYPSVDSIESALNKLRHED